MARQANIHNRMKRRAQQVIKRRKKQANRQKKAESKRAAQNKKQLCTTAVSTLWNGYLVTKNTRFSILPGVF